MIFIFSQKGAKDNFQSACGPSAVLFCSVGPLQRADTFWSSVWRPLGVLGGPSGFLGAPLGAYLDISITRGAFGPLEELQKTLKPS